MASIIIWNQIILIKVLIYLLTKYKQKRDIERFKFLILHYLNDLNLKALCISKEDIYLGGFLNTKRNTVIERNDQGTDIVSRVTDILSVIVSIDYIRLE